MTFRIVELIFRRALFLALPLVVGGVIGLMWFIVGYGESSFGSRATIWVDRPSAVSGGAVADFNTYISPAQNQTTGLQELLGTQAFVTAVATAVDGVEPVSEQRIDQIRTNTSISPYGSHVVYVEYRSKNAGEVALTVKAILDKFADDFTAQVKSRAASTANFYSTQLVPAKVAYDKANTAVQEYVRGRPQLATVNLQNPPASVTGDTEFAKLIEAQQSAKESYGRILASYDESRITATSSDGTAAYFQILDQPSAPFRTRQSGRSLLIRPIAALLVSIMASSLLLILFWRIDRKVRVPSDLAFLGPDVQVVSLGSLRAKRRRWPKSFVRLATALDSGMRIDN
jgi:hypothetical protein